MKWFYVDRKDAPNSRHLWRIVDEWGSHAESSAWGYETREAAQEDLGRVTWTENQPVGVRVSTVLSEVRTVLSRLDTAIDTLTRGNMNDPERAAVVSALRSARVELLPFQRTGRMPKYNANKEEK